MTVYGRLPSSALENAKLCTVYGSLSLCVSCLFPSLFRASLVYPSSPAPHLEFCFVFPILLVGFWGAKLWERGIFFFSLNGGKCGRSGDMSGGMACIASVGGEEHLMRLRLLLGCVVAPAFFEDFLLSADPESISEFAEAPPRRRAWEFEAPPGEVVWTAAAGE
jgi:hypothetical protein